MNRPVAFVTGGTGFIGRLLVTELAGRGFAVRVLVRDQAKFQRLFNDKQGVVPVPGDCLDPAPLRQGIAGATYVFHLAGITKAVQAKAFEAGNHTACRILAGAVRDAGRGLARVLHVSSLAAAGPSPTPTPQEELGPPNPLSRYGRTKLAGEMVMRELGGEFPVTVVRPPVVFGPADTDIFLFMRTVWSSFIPILGHDEKRFSLVYAPDLAHGLVEAALAPAAAGRSYCLCYPEPMRWSEFGQLTAEALGVQRRVRRIPHPALAAAAFFAEAWSCLTRRPSILSCDKYREGVHPYWVCSPRAARADFDFTPQTPVAEAVRQTVTWYRDHGWLT